MYHSRSITYKTRPFFFLYFHVSQSIFHVARLNFVDKRDAVSVRVQVVASIAQRSQIILKRDRGVSTSLAVATLPRDGNWRSNRGSQEIARHLTWGKSLGENLRERDFLASYAIDISFSIFFDTLFCFHGRKFRASFYARERLDIQFVHVQKSYSSSFISIRFKVNLQI